MPLTYNPKDAVSCLPEGDYQASLKTYEEKKSKVGNNMAVLTWAVYPNDDGPSRLVTDYIVLPDGTWKLKKMAKALGKEAEFRECTFQPEREIGCTVVVTLKIKEQEGFDDKNVIAGFKQLEKPRAEVSAARQKYEDAANADVKPNYAPDSVHDEIPF